MRAHCVHGCGGQCRPLRGLECARVRFVGCVQSCVAGAQQQPRHAQQACPGQTWRVRTRWALGRACMNITFDVPQRGRAGKVLPARCAHIRRSGASVPLQLTE